MQEWARFELGGYTFVASLPSGAGEDQVFTLTVMAVVDGHEVRRETIPLTYEPIFGPDVSDVAALNARVEEIIKDMKLE